ncbi:MAG: hypothetical protein PGN25_15050 [Methylorubrum populi]
MRRELVSDEEMAARIGGVSAGTVRKLRFRERGPSVRVTARIEAVTAGEVRAADLVPKAPAAPAEAGACP